MGDRGTRSIEAGGNWPADHPAFAAAATLVAELVLAGFVPVRSEPAPQAARRPAGAGAKGRRPAPEARPGPAGDPEAARKARLLDELFKPRPVPPRPLGDETRHRQALGLPAGTRLRKADIREAFRRSARTAHPDAGGDQVAFQTLVAARDALLETA